MIYDVVIKQRFGPWGRAMERAGVRAVAQKYLDKKRRRAERKQLAKERRRLLREEKEMEAAQSAGIQPEAAEAQLAEE